ncbi:cobyrinate a,c-diamide synthase [Desulfitibacter alkalitolerans]|uniref:cobyrinate a,c-diamide synthase n=1 Tax=Desulfitibacter alkalitolerans TaxID=264641 RepID=UPI0004841A88|nr:cobyrinate a,c-diamide synthase [Desulfitibacter alkalitolerans]
MTEKYLIPRIVIAAPHGRSGKTTITLGLLRAYTKKGIKVQSFKKGPDYIDPSWHTKVTGTLCRNLDCYMMDDETLKKSFIKGTQKSTLSIIEGAMGLHDGFDLDGTGSTAQVAKIIKAPVIFVVDTRRMTRSVAPLVMGFQQFDKDVEIAGVILNQVARSRHEKILRGSIEKYCGIPVIGAIPKDSNMTIPDRHLGLIPAHEDEKHHQSIEYIANSIQQNVDLDLLMRIAKNAKPLEVLIPVNNNNLSDKNIKIGVIRDRAFSFYYPENLEALEEFGAELIYIDSLNDTNLPDIDGLYIGGGFPEVFAEELENNATLRKQIKDKAERGLPIYAECGGLMYLGQKIITDRNHYDMVGIFPFVVRMEDKPQGHGYTRLIVNNPNPFFKDLGLIIRGHEFHNSRILNLDSSAASFAFRVERGSGIDGLADGITYKNVLATYNHIHSLSSPQWAQGFLELVKGVKVNG